MGWAGCVAPQTNLIPQMDMSKNDNEPICSDDEEDRNLRRVSYLQATKEERMDTEVK